MAVGEHLESTIKHRKRCVFTLNVIFRKITHYRTPSEFRQNINLKQVLHVSVSLQGLRVILLMFDLGGRPKMDFYQLQEVLLLRGPFYILLSINFNLSVPNQHQSMSRTHFRPNSQYSGRHSGFYWPFLLP